MTVCARRAGQAEELLRAVAAALPDAAGRLAARAFPDDLPALAEEADLIVNATSLGLHEGDPAPWTPAARLRPGQVAYDLIYNRKTEFLRLAAEQGAQAIDGLGMLVQQGARAFELWTGMAAPVDVMRAAAEG